MKSARVGATEVGNIWSQRTDWETVCRRAAGRKRYNAVKTFLADLRREEVLVLLIARGGLVRGSQAEIAKQLGVHRSTISKDIKRLMPLARPCETCGTLRPRAWWADD